jgi:hypothetical protein
MGPLRTHRQFWSTRFYDQHRAAGDLHHQALRALGNRLVGILHGCLRHLTAYNENTAWAPPPNHPSRLTSYGPGMSTMSPPYLLSPCLKRNSRQQPDCPRNGGFDRRLTRRAELGGMANDVKDLP